MVALVETVGVQDCSEQVALWQKAAIEASGQWRRLDSTPHWTSSFDVLLRAG